MDPAARRALWVIVEHLRAEGRSVVLTTHYMEEAERLCDRVAVMDHGRILEIGTVGDLVSRRFRDRAVVFNVIDRLADTFEFHVGPDAAFEAGARHLLTRGYR